MTPFSHIIEVNALYQSGTTGFGCRSFPSLQHLRVMTTHSDSPPFLLEVTDAFNSRAQEDSGRASITHALIMHYCEVLLPA